MALWKGPSKGKADDPSTYRGLQIGSTLCKIIVILITNRMKEWYENQLTEQQQGFRTSRSTTDGLFLIKSLQQIAYKTKKIVPTLFIDLTAAFDHINRNWLFDSIKQRLNNQDEFKLFKLLQDLYKKTTTSIENHNFEISLGVRQGGPESPLLFNLYLDYVMRAVKDECKKQNIKFTKHSYLIPKPASSNQSILGKYGNFILDWVGFADDIVMMFEDINDLKNTINIINTIFSRFGLTINPSKTKTMLINFDKEESEYPETIAKMGNLNIENIKIFKYLGCQIHYKQQKTGDSEINERIDMAETTFCQHSKKLMNHKVKIVTRTLILNSLVRSRLTYGCQVWLLDKTQIDKLNSTYTLMLRKMIRGGFRRKPNEWGFIFRNEDLLKICKTKSIEIFVERQRKRYMGHIIRRSDTAPTKKILFNNEKNCKIGRPHYYIGSVLGQENINEFVSKAKRRYYHN